MRQKVDRMWWVLRIALGAGPFLAGLDKFLNLLTDWTMYLSPLVTQLAPLSPRSFMHLVGVIEMAAGILVFTRFTRQAAYIIAAWLVAIALNLVTTGAFYDLAVRDLEIAVAAFILAQLTEVRARLAERERPLANAA